MCLADYKHSNSFFPDYLPELIPLILRVVRVSVSLALNVQGCNLECRFLGLLSRAAMGQRGAWVLSWRLWFRRGLRQRSRVPRGLPVCLYSKERKPFKVEIGIVWLSARCVRVIILDVGHSALTVLAIPIGALCAHGSRGWERALVSLSRRVLPRRYGRRLRYGRRSGTHRTCPRVACDRLQEW